MENTDSQRLEKILIQLEKSKFGAYADLMQRPLRMIAINLAAGLARGFGFAIGFALLGAIAIIVLQKLVLLNLPVIGSFIAEVVKLVKLNIR